MKTKLLLPPACLLAVFLFISLPHRARAQAPPPAPARPDTSQLLREALFEEQGVRDFDKAAAAYQKVIAAYDAERQLAATALYRLAEVRRAQNKKDEATTLYQRLLTEFPTHDPLARLSRENLAALGVKEIPGAVPVPPADAEDAKIAELKKLMVASPDLVTGKDPLLEAAKKGQSRVVSFLLEAGVTPTEHVLRNAAISGHLAVCEALIAHGAAYRQSAALIDAITNNRTGIVRYLLAKGADPDFGPDAGGSPLLSAVTLGNEAIVNLLLEAKANPNLPPPAQSPLFAAVQRGDVTITKKLLAAGADPDVRTIDPRTSSMRQPPLPGRPPVPGGGADPSSRVKKWSLLHAAVASTKPEMLDLILTLKPDLEAPGPEGGPTALDLALELDSTEMATRLLKAGASPGTRSGTEPPLHVAVKHRNETLVKQLIAAGADVNDMGADGVCALAFLADNAWESMPLIRLLIAAGADPEAGKYPLMANARGTAAVSLARQIRYPKTTSSGDITLSLPESGVWKPLASENKPGAGSPPSLADLLLELPDFERRGNYEPDWTTLHLFRRNPDGKMEEQILTKWLETPVPVLQWGDVLEFVSHFWDKQTGPAANQNNFLRGSLPPEILSRLRAALVRHVTVNLDGKSYPMTLRGALKVYNPLKPEAPLTDAVSLIKMMGGDDPQWFNSSVRVKRLPEQGGGEITSPLRTYSIVPLKEGDTLELTGDPVTWQRNGNGIAVTGTDGPAGGNYTEDIFLLSPDLPFSRIIRKSSFSSPTLMQLLAAAFPPLAAESLAKLATSEKADGVLNLTGSRAAQMLTDQDLQSILPHPDWSRIKIRRISPNNEIAEIPVDWAAAIAACTDATTPEEARKADVELMAGDTILLPVRRDLKDQPWTGWDAGTIRFFSKALAMQVTLADADGSFRALNLEYLPVRYIDTAAGLLGLPAREPAAHLLSAFSTPALLAGAAPGRSLAWLQRAGSADRTGPDNTSPVWLRDKDTVGIAPSPQSGVAVPRRRINLPPQPGQPGQ